MKTDIFGGEYSTEEQLVGKWIDGKPLYQRTFTGTFAGSGGGYDFNHNIENVDFIANVFSITAPGSDNLQRSLSFAYYADSSWTCCINVSKTYIRLQYGNGFAGAYGGKKFYVTLQYTKTTD